VNIKIYVEGGGDRDSLKRKCRRGFSEFFRKAGLNGRMPRIVASGSRKNAYDDFCVALKNSENDEFIVLLVDSEDPVTTPKEPWSHLKTRDNWDKPPGVTDDNVHLMVQCMEAWLIADSSTLARFFGKDFNSAMLPKTQQIEKVSKSDLYASLEKSTQALGKKKRYGKGRHSFDILEKIDPKMVMTASPYAKRLIDTLQKKANM